MKYIVQSRVSSYVANVDILAFEANENEADERFKKLSFMLQLASAFTAAVNGNVTI